MWGQAGLQSNLAMGAVCGTAADVNTLPLQHSFTGSLEGSVVGHAQEKGACRAALQVLQLHYFLTQEICVLHA